MVLTELLQNAVEHGFGYGDSDGDVVVPLAHEGDLHIRVTDNSGVMRVDLDQACGLGLSIVHTLVTTELAGTISIDPASTDDLTLAGLSPGNGSVAPWSHFACQLLTTPTIRPRLRMLDQLDVADRH